MTESGRVTAETRRQLEWHFLFEFCKAVTIPLLVQHGTRWAADPADMTREEALALFQFIGEQHNMSIRVHWKRFPIGIVGWAHRRRSWWSGAPRVSLTSEEPTHIDTVIHECAHLLPDGDGHGKNFFRNYAVLISQCVPSMTVANLHAAYQDAKKDLLFNYLAQVAGEVADILGLDENPVRFYPVEAETSSDATGSNA